MCVLRSEEDSEEQNSHSNLDEISTKTMLPNDKEKLLHLPPIKLFILA